MFNLLELLHVNSLLISKCRSMLAHRKKLKTDADSFCGSRLGHLSPLRTPERKLSAGSWERGELVLFQNGGKFGGVG